MGYETAILNSVPLFVRSCTPIRTQKKFKQIMGKSMSQVSIIGIDDNQWELSLSCVVLGTTQSNLDTNRTSIQALDSCSPYAFVDGLHNGTYYVVPESIIFTDVGGESNSSYRFTIKLVQE